MTTGRFGGGPPAAGCGGGGTGCRRGGGVAATGGGVSFFAGNLPSLLPPMSDRSIGMGEGNTPPGVCWGEGEGLASVALEVGVGANRSRPGDGTPVRKSLIGEGVGGVRSF